MGWLLKDIVLPKRTKSETLAEHAAIERLLNAYLRENNIIDPRTLDHHFEVNLPKSKKKISGSLIYWSAIGHHSYGETFYQSNNEEITPTNVMDLLINEISYLEQDEKKRVERKKWLKDLITNSMSKTTSYIAHAKNHLKQWTYIDSEQSLRLGHPFHPTPKSSEGFSEHDLSLYSPELGASFPLHYFAVEKSCLKEEWVSHECLDEETYENTDYELLPLHPWQANYLLGFEEVKEAIQQGRIIDMGRGAQPVYPTSSVRTVWDPVKKIFYKLPLHIRITNFIRTNSVEQVKRTMDAAKVLVTIRDRYETDQFRFLIEKGYRALSIPERSKERKEAFIQNTAVLFREGVDWHEEEGLYVTASLLEEHPMWKESELARLIKANEIDEEKWLSQYVAVTFIPLLTLLAETGVSVEAHVQNSLIQLENGWPKKCFVRDLEGVSIARNKAKEFGWTNQLIKEDSPVLYREEEAWFRFTYYVVVNHLGHLISSLGKVRQLDERRLWKVVRTVLQEVDEPIVKPYVHKLLHSETFPAKANLISRFQECSETPLYVEIPNPMYEGV